MGVAKHIAHLQGAGEGGGGGGGGWCRRNLMRMRWRNTNSGSGKTYCTLARGGGGCHRHIYGVRRRLGELKIDLDLGTYRPER